MKIIKLYRKYCEKHKYSHAKSKVQIEKSIFINYNMKFKNADSGGKINNFSSDRKWTDLIRQRWTSKCLFPRQHIVYSLKSVFHKWEKITNFL